MASPFDPFRKKQKQMLAVVGVLCMFGFILGPMTCDTGPPVQPSANTPTATIAGETLPPEEVQALLDNHLMATRFIAYVGGLQYPPWGELSPAMAVQIEARARVAEDFGITISDDAVNHVIEQLNSTRPLRIQDGQPLTDVAMLNYVQSQGWSMDQVFDAVRWEMASQQATLMFLPSEDTSEVSLARMWDYYKRVHRRIHSQVLPVSVETFISQVEEPSEADLQSLFDDYKLAPPHPATPEPGFIQLPKVSADYVVARYDDFYRQARRDLTDEEIETYYEENKETQFVYSGFVENEWPLVAPSVSSDDAENGEAEGGNAVDGDAQATDQDDAAGNATDNATDGNAGAGGGDDAGNTGDGNVDNSSSGTTGGADGGSGGDATGTGTQGGGGGASGLIRASTAPFSNSEAIDGCDPELIAGDLAADGPIPFGAQDNSGGTQDDQSGDDGNQDIGNQDDATQGAGDQATTTQDNTNQDNTNQDTTNQDDQADNQQPPVGQGVLSDTDDVRSLQQVAESFRMPEDIRDGASTPEFDPLWKVRSRIVRTLTQQKTTDAITTAFDEIRKVLDDYQAERTKYLAEVGEFNPNDASNPDRSERRADIRLLIEGLAQQHGVEFKQDGLKEMDQWEVLDYEPLEKVLQAAQQIFAPNSDSFKPLENTPATAATTTGTRDHYLLWKTEETEFVEPESLNDVREQVVHAWKMQQARELAKEEAERIAEECAAGAKLEDYVNADRKLIRLAPFTWYTKAYDPTQFDPAMFNYQMMPYTPTSLPALKFVGTDFMKSTFALNDLLNNVGVASNAPENIFYVVHAEKFDFVRWSSFGGIQDVGLPRSDAYQDFVNAGPAALRGIYFPDNDYMELNARLSEIQATGELQ